MPSRIDEAGHTFDYPVTEHWGKAEMFSSAGGTRTDNTSVGSRTRYQLSRSGSPGGSSVKNSPATGRPSPWGRACSNFDVLTSRLLASKMSAD